MFKPGDVVGFYSQVADKRKYHLCISLNGCYLFLNSPKARAYAGDLEIDCGELPITPTESGRSIVSCSMVLRVSDQELKQAGAVLIGTADKGVLKKVVAFVETSEALSPEDVEAILDGLGDWL